EKVPTALENEAGVFPLFGLDRPRETLPDHFRKADDRVERRAQLMADVCQELRFGLARGFRSLFRASQVALGPHLIGDVASGPAIAEEPAFRIEPRLPAYRRGACSAGILPDVGEIAEGLVALEHGVVLLPHDHPVAGSHRHFLARMPDKFAWLGAKTDGADPIRHIREAMVLVGLPKPVRRDLGKLAEPGLAVFKPAELGGERFEEDREPDNRTQRTQRNNRRLVAPGSERHLL